MKFPVHSSLYWKAVFIFPRPIFCSIRRMEFKNRYASSDDAGELRSLKNTSVWGKWHLPGRSQLGGSKLRGLARVVSSCWGVGHLWSLISPPKAMPSTPKEPSGYCWICPVRYFSFLSKATLFLSSPWKPSAVFFGKVALLKNECFLYTGPS